MKVFFMLTALLATSSAGSIGGESSSLSDHGYTYGVGHSGGISGRYTDALPYGAGTPVVEDFKPVKTTPSYASSEASGLSGGYNVAAYHGDIGYGGANDGAYSHSFSSGPYKSGYNDGHNENIQIIKIIHEFVKSNRVQNRANSYGPKGFTTYKLIHDYGHNNGGPLEYSYLSPNNHAASGQRTEEPNQIIKVIHEKPQLGRHSPHSSISYNHFEQPTAHPIKSPKPLGAFANLPSNDYSASQIQYLPTPQEYFPPATSGGYKYKQ